jgi:hypothetical protein
MGEDHHVHVEVGHGPETQFTNSKWSRAPMPPVDQTKDTLTFQQIDIDFYEGNFKKIEKSKS